MRFDVNETLLRHIATGGGAAFTLRKAADCRLTEFISELFNARSDVRRLDRAQQVARTILHINDFTDIMDLRDIVAQQELRRLISYSKQKDHTAHTVYLYLLGIWFFDHVSDLRTAIFEHSECKTDNDACAWFLFQWMFASLLHDIGYAFYDLSSETVCDRERIDEAYSWNWLKKIIDPTAVSGRKLSKKTLIDFQNVHSRWQMKFARQMPAPTAKYAPGACAEVLNRLGAAPWLGDLNSDWIGRDIFDVLTISPQADLRTYAMTVAAEGYAKGGIGCVDHAVASGLMLFQYCSYWYWLMNELRSIPHAYSEVTAGFNYSLENISTIADACRAVAYHNVQSSVGAGANILRCVTLKSDPILFMSIIQPHKTPDSCLEMQRLVRRTPSLLVTLKMPPAPAGGVSLAMNYKFGIGLQRGMHYYVNSNKLLLRQWKGEILNLPAPVRTLGLRLFVSSTVNSAIL